MSGGSERDDTVAGDTALGVDDTVQLPSDHKPPTTPPAGQSQIIRSGRSSSDRTQLGRYRIVNLLGRGGMGKVYAADDPELGRRVAIKVLREDRAHAPALLREAKALAKLVHPNVVTVHDVGTDGGDVFIVMQLVEGESIDAWVATHHPGARAIVAAFRQAGLGLAAAHAAGLVHCDVKPGNILVGRDDVVRVGDFGLARAAGDEVQIAGTPAYMAPEQFDGKVTAASDQFSFCVALWEALAGERPFAETSVDGSSTKIGASIAMRRTRRPLPKIRIPSRILRALERGLAEDPADRFPDMAALLAALAPPRWPRVAIGSAVVLAVTALVAFGLARSTPRAVTPAAPPAPVAPPPPRLDAAHQRALTSYGVDACAYAPSIAQDGTVVFDRTQGDAVDLYALPLAGGTARQLTSDATWEWRSNRGRRPGEVLHLVHDTTDAKRSAIAALDLATGTDTRVIETLAHDAAAVGDAIYYIALAQHEIRVWRSGKDTTFVASPGEALHQLAASPRGDWLAIIGLRDEQLQLCLAELATATLRCGDQEITESRPAFSPDGRNVYYATDQGIRRREVATQLDELVLPEARARGGLAVAPDGNGLVYSDCGARSQVVDVMAPRTSIVDDPTALDPAPGPHGALAWTRIRRGKRVLVARLADGKELELTNPDYGDVANPAWSPDGEMIAFTAAAPHAGIHAAPVRTELPITDVTEGATDRRPQWIDNEWLAFTRYDEHDAPTSYVGGIDGNVRKLAANRLVIGARRGRILAWASTRLVWIDPKTAAEQPGPQSPPVLIKTGVSPSGEWLAFATATTGSEVWRLSVQHGGAPEHVATLPAGQTSHGPPAITDDGHILVTPQTWSGDLMYVPAAAGTHL